MTVHKCYLQYLCYITKEKPESETEIDNKYRMIVRCGVSTGLLLRYLYHLSLKLTQQFY